ncbi:MAG: molybdenum ABC transporter ATP-binding protein [Rhizomicrobium sp.]
MSVECAIRHSFGAFALDVEFGVEHRGITALFGPSGAGKTTVTNAIAGLFRPHEGRIVLDGETVFDSTSGRFVRPQSRGAVAVFQDARLFPHMTVKQNLFFGWRRAKNRVALSEVERVFDLLGIGALLQRRPAKLSGGEKSRVALGRALLASPRLLLLDEPLAALDAQRKAEIMPYLERLRDDANIPMIYVTHSLDEVTRLADHLIVMQHGRIGAQGSVFDLLPRLEFETLGREGAYGAVLRATVSQHRSDGLSMLGFDGGTLAIPKISRPVGTKLRVRLRAEDIMLARDEPKAISANNILPAIVDDVRADGPSHADVRLRCGNTRLVARITQSSVARLGIAPGQHLYAVIKSVIVDPQRGRETDD